MKKIALLLGCLFLTPAYALDPQVERLKKENRETVKHWTKFCKDSKCKKCGLFYNKYAEQVDYDTDPDGEVISRVDYELSFCEVEYHEKLQEEKHKATDKEIRKKYGQ